MRPWLVTPILCAGLAMGLLIATTQVVRAERTYLVRVVSDPPGATLYIDDKAKGAVGKTPYKGRLSRGPHVLVLELDGYEPAVEDISVKKRRKRQTFKIELAEVATGTVEVSGKPDDAGAFGAQILVDGKDSGEVPEILELSAGAHQLEVRKNGYKPYDEWIEVAKGETVKVVVGLVPLAGAKTKVKDKALVQKTPGPKGAGPRITGGAGLELGFRSYGYKGPTSGMLLPIDTGVVAVLHLTLVVNPFARSRSKHMQRVALLGDLALAAPIESSTDDGMQVVDTVWRELSLAVNYTLPVTNDVSLAPRLGYGQRLFAFDTGSAVTGQLPDVDYRFLALGTDVIMRRGRLHGYVGADWLPVLSTGPLAERFQDASVSAYELRIGGGAALKPRVELRVSAHYARFGHTFTSMPGDMYEAESGTDRFYGVTLGAVYRY